MVSGPDDDEEEGKSHFKKEKALVDGQTEKRQT